MLTCRLDFLRRMRTGRDRVRRRVPSHWRSLQNFAGAIARTIEAIRDFTGRAPRGWESPGLTETFDTIDHLGAAGIEYVADWVLDDQPVEIATASGSVLSIPYTVETNDITMIALQQHPGGEILERASAQFDRLYAESAEITRIMALSLHPYITGVPHRIGYLERFLAHLRDHSGVLLWTGEQILDWYRSQPRPE